MCMHGKYIMCITNVNTFCLFLNRNKKYIYSHCTHWTDTYCMKKSKCGGSLTIMQYMQITFVRLSMQLTWNSSHRALDCSGVVGSGLIQDLKK